MIAVLLDDIEAGVRLRLHEVETGREVYTDFDEDEMLAFATDILLRLSRRKGVVEEVIDGLDD